MLGISNCRCFTAPFLLALLPAALLGQSELQPPESSAGRIFGIIPNYRTFPSLTHYKALSAKEKFDIAYRDVSDRGTFVLAAAFAGDGMLAKSSPSFGHGMEGYSRYLGTSFCDLAVGDYMTEAIYPTLLHQDPRYFRRGAGSGWSRLGYAMGQIFWTHTDSGGTQFNVSEIAGNATGVALSNAYYPDGRTAAKNLSRLGTQICADMAGNVLKEFWPDLRRKLSHKKRG
jgi:hypothetical protein